ncbi:MAG: hypothetical protein HOB79_07910 [Rhodospirillaceae bacterium]|nr:hypothetical protein [Rhodospirillales bacterium]MBT3904762.1 hypothetical protein [Rhodospirillaceae bacterium]MBT4700988.1 hypothetical protein [Rhodospirillaceae bacterium]MBT5035234.1 hypothetical protein [Rhodospirillaceae bacterium]MBT6221597.1 hypothetical protein [Rhodospirillaceae bacterium]
MKLLSIQELSTRVVLVAAVFLTACAAPPEQSSETAPAITPSEPLAVKPPPATNPPKPATAAAVQTEDNKPAQKASPAPPADKDYAALVPKGNRDPGTLVGLKPDRLIEILGPPGFRRADAPAEIWQYRYGGCVLNLILYETGKNKTLNVSHYTIRSVAEKNISDWNCLLGLLIDRQKKLDGVS